jgi:hypothetical protein
MDWHRAGALEDRMSEQLESPLNRRGWRGRWLKPLAIAAAAVLLVLAAADWYWTRRLPLCDLALVAVVLLVALVPTPPPKPDQEP